MQDPQWHYMDGQKSSGPHTEEDITSLIETKKIPVTVLVWSKDSQDWKPANQVFNLEGLFPPPLPGAKDTFFQMPHIDKKLTKVTWTDTAAHPWRRYLARMLDTAIIGSLSFMLLGMLLYAVVPGFAASFFEMLISPSGRLLDIMITFFIVMFLNAAFLGFTGGSIGKFFFGIKILDQHNRPIGYQAALKRELFVWFKGLGFGIPLVSLITMIASYSTLTNKGQTSWDEDMQLRVIYRDKGIQHYALCACGFIIFMITLSILRAI